MCDCDGLAESKPKDLLVLDGDGGGVSKSSVPGGGEIGGESSSLRGDGGRGSGASSR